MDILRGEEIHHLIQDPVYKGVGLRITETEISLVPCRTTTTRELRKGIEYLTAVARHLDLRDHLYASLLSEADHFADLLLRVVPTIAADRVRGNMPSVTGVPPGHKVRLATISSLAYQLRNALDLQAPSTAIREMPVKLIELIPSHLIKKSEDKGEGHIVT